MNQGALVVHTPKGVVVEEEEVDGCCRGVQTCMKVGKWVVWLGRGREGGLNELLDMMSGWVNRSTHRQKAYTHPPTHSVQHLIRTASSSSTFLLTYPSIHPPTHPPIPIGHL